MAPTQSKPSLYEMVTTLTFPWQFMMVSSCYLPGTIVNFVSTGNVGAFFSWDRFQSAWFSRFWDWAGPNVRTSAEAMVVPLLEGRVSNGNIISPSDAHAPGVGGVVLEVGPGSGNWVSIFSDKYLGSAELATSKSVSGTRSKVTRVYGVEPNPGVHPLLRKRIEEAGLEDTYEIVPVGIEDLERSGRVARESLDCIVTVLCLCSIPDPERNIRELYSYLKPGGRWYVFEHVRAYRHQGWPMRIYQGLFCSLLTYPFSPPFALPIGTIGSHNAGCLGLLI